MHDKFLLALAAIFVCVACRVLLNIIDRKIYKSSIDRGSFQANIFLNSLAPCVFGFLFSTYFGNPAFDLLFTPWALFNGLAYFLTGTAFCYGFANLNVKSVVVYSKLADLSTPLIFFAVGKSPNIGAFVFNIATIASFGPIFLKTFSKNNFRFTPIVFIIFSLSMQTCIYLLFLRPANSVLSFCNEFVNISVWRLFFSLIFLVSAREKNFGISISSIKASIFRCVPAFFAQVAPLFAISIYEKISAYTVPVLNSSPLLASFAAHILLKEKISMFESMSTALFVAVVVSHFIF